MKMFESNVEQLELLCVRESEQKVPAERLCIVSLQLVKETSLHYKERCVQSRERVYKLFKQLLDEPDREYFVVMCLDANNQPIVINICHIGCLNTIITHRIVKPEPLPEVIDFRKRLVKVGKIIVIELEDHLIIDKDRFISPREKGYIG